MSKNNLKFSFFVLSLHCLAVKHLIEIVQLVAYRKKKKKKNWPQNYNVNTKLHITSISFPVRCYGNNVFEDRAILIAQHAMAHQSVSQRDLWKDIALRSPSTISGHLRELVSWLRVCEYYHNR